MMTSCKCGTGGTLNQISALALTAVLVLLLVGCGPSASERQAKTELAETQKKLATASAEFLSQQKIGTEAAAKSSAELELLRKQLSETQASLINAQAKALALQGEIERDRKLHEETKIKSNAPPANYEVSGEIFVVTKGGANFKLGLVNVQVFEKSVIQKFVTEKITARDNRLADLEPREARAEEEWKAASDAATKAVYAPAKKFLGLMKLKDEKWKVYEDLSTQTRALRSGAYSFAALPGTKFVVKSNSDGRFRFSVSRDEEVVIAASASRAVGGDTEKYYWLVPVARPDGASIEIALSNDNLSSVRGGGSLIYTSDSSD